VWWANISEKSAPVRRTITPKSALNCVVQPPSKRVTAGTLTWSTRNSGGERRGQKEPSWHGPTLGRTSRALFLLECRHPFVLNSYSKSSPKNAYKKDHRGVLEGGDHKNT
jgi:hypothetical protein